jgi:PAS domain S-box-containing protein
MMAGLYQEAEARLRARRKDLKADGRVSRAKSARVIHQLEVYQIELELQNAELQKARNELESALEKYTELYDFAPVGYFTLGADSRIHLVNLAGARLVGMERSRLMGRFFRLHVAVDSQPVFRSFLSRVFAGESRPSCEVTLMSAGGRPRPINIEAERSPDRQECRAVVVDITERKRAEATQRRIDVLAASNQKLELEIVRRQAVEKSLKKSEHHQSRLLERSQRMQEQLRNLSRQVLQVQERERKRISRELHDVIGQTLTSINVRLANLRKDVVLDPRNFGRSVVHTQRLVEKAVNIVHRFARELRPTALDDLGLIPALRAFMNGFREETGIHVGFSTVAAVEHLKGDKRIVLYRVVQEALNNVARHAQASRVDVRIQKFDSAICMQITDNGKGFSTTRVLHAKKQSRLGLLGVRERLTMVNGNFTIKSIPGKGTTLEAHIPLGVGGTSSANAKT